MTTIKEIYKCRQDLIIREDLSDLQNLLCSNGVQTVTLNNDRTIRIESPDGLDRIVESINSAIPAWCGFEIPCPVNLMYNLFPLSNNACILKL